jgi:hypothetical protein
MKRKLLILAVMLTLVLSVFVISVSGAETTVENENFQGGVLYKSTTNEFGTVNVALAGKISPNSKFDTTSRVVLKNDDNVTYSTYPSAYIYQHDNYADKLDFNSLNTISKQNYEMADIVRIEIPEGNNHVSGFTNSTTLIYVKIAASPSTIRGNCFKGCTSLTTVEFAYDFVKYPQYGSNLTTISNGSVFSGCTALERLEFPNSVTNVGNAGLSGCSALEYLNLGLNFNNVDGGSSFGSLASLETLILTHNFTGSKLTFGNKDKYTTSEDLVIYYTGSLAQLNTLRAITSLPYEITKSTPVSYKTFTSKDFVRVEGVRYIVYDYGICDAFYNGNHNYEGTGNCLEGVECTQCHDEIESFTEHKMVETLVYPNGFTGAGIYNKFCANASDCTANKISNVEKPTIFIMNEDNGFSESGKDGIAFGGYCLNADALNEYNRVNKDAPVKYGVVLINPDYLDGKDSFFKDGKVNSTTENKGFLQTDMSSARYANISISVTGFTGNAENLSIILAIYAYTDANDVEFIQSQTTECASEKVTLGETSLYTVTLASVKAGNSNLLGLGDYVMPSKREQQA